MKPQPTPSNTFTFSPAEQQVIKYQVTVDKYNQQGFVITDPTEYFDTNFPLGFLNFKRTLTDEMRNDFIYGVMGNYILLNPGISKDRIKGSIKYKVSKLYFNSISEFWLNESLDNLFEQYAAGTLRPYGVTYKSFWISPSVTNKREVYHLARKTESLDKLTEFFEEILPSLFCVINDEFIAEYMDMGLNSVRRNLTPQQIELKKEFNLVVRAHQNEEKKKLKAEKRKLKNK